VRFVVTAGPTREPIDPVRFLSNRSSGRMGYAIAEAAVEAGHDVTLISGPVSLGPPDNVRIIPIQTSDEMYDAVRRAVLVCDVLVMCAAIADFKPANYSSQKLKKKSAALSLPLIPTRDILASIGNQERSFMVVGFAAETENLAANAEKKLREKNCDAIVANNVSSSDYGMESAENEVTIFFRNGETKQICRAPKKNIARELVKIISNMREKCLTKKT
jgi:phosphopantothenoylcysteine decarboxylase / phosphopantothenate---cysteine ligase